MGILLRKTWHTLNNNIRKEVISRSRYPMGKKEIIVRTTSKTIKAIFENDDFASKCA